MSISSKGLGSQGLVFKDNEENKNNVYIKCFNKHLKEKIKNAFSNLFRDSEKIHILGEVFGKGVQDLTYNQNSINFRTFYVLKDDRILPLSEMEEFCNNLNIHTVPILYKGEHSKKLADELCEGMSEFDKNQIKEGIVITPLKDIESFSNVVKHINPSYLLRKNGTEYN